MVPRSKVHDAARLLAEGKSHRAVSRAVGMSRATVAKIASGEWSGMYGVRFVGDVDEESAPNLNAPAERCAGCGGLVHLPCVLCRVRAHTASVRAKGSKAGRLAGQVIRAEQVRAAVAAEDARQQRTASGSTELVGAR